MRTPLLIARDDRRRRQGDWRYDRDEERAPNEHRGRYCFFREGLLNITATLETMDWILRLHDALLKALATQGMKTQWYAATDRDQHGTGQRSACIQLSKFEETFTLEFTQGYRQIPVPPKELAERRRRELWAAAINYVPSDKFTLKVTGTEHRAHKSWAWEQPRFEENLADIVSTILALVPLQQELRRQREIHLEETRRRAEIAEAQRRREEAVAQQLKQAFLMSETDAQVRRLNTYLDRLESDLDGLQEPYRERCRVWLRVVRAELQDADPVDRLLMKSLTAQDWRPWPPDWWPDEARSTDEPHD